MVALVGRASSRAVLLLALLSTINSPLSTLRAEPVGLLYERTNNTITKTNLHFKEVVIDNGLTLGGVRRTTWPSGGSGGTSNLSDMYGTLHSLTNLPPGTVTNGTQTLQLGSDPTAGPPLFNWAVGTGPSTLLTNSATLGATSVTWPVDQIAPNFNGSLTGNASTATTATTANALAGASLTTTGKGLGIGGAFTTAGALTLNVTNSFTNVLVSVVGDSGVSLVATTNGVGGVTITASSSSLLSSATAAATYLTRAATNNAPGMVYQIWGVVGFSGMNDYYTNSGNNTFYPISGGSYWVYFSGDYNNPTVRDVAGDIFTCGGVGVGGFALLDVNTSDPNGRMELVPYPGAIIGRASAYQGDGLFNTHVWRSDTNVATGTPVDTFTAGQYPLVSIIAEGSGTVGRIRTYCNLTGPLDTNATYNVFRSEGFLLNSNGSTATSERPAILKAATQPYADGSFKTYYLFEVLKSADATSQDADGGYANGLTVSSYSTVLVGALKDISDQKASNAIAWARLQIRGQGTDRPALWLESGNLCLTLKNGMVEFSGNKFWGSRNMARTNFLFANDDAGSLTNLNASSLLSGTIPDARLSGNFNTVQITNTLTASNMASLHFSAPATGVSISTNVTGWTNINNFLGQTDTSASALHTGDTVSLLTGSGDTRGTIIIKTLSNSAGTASAAAATLTFGTNYSTAPFVVLTTSANTNISINTTVLYNAFSVTTSNCLIRSSGAQTANSAWAGTYFIIQ